MNTLPIESLELRALEQRNRLHQTTAELKTKVAAARAETRHIKECPRTLGRSFDHLVSCGISVGIWTSWNIYPRLGSA